MNGRGQGKKYDARTGTNFWEESSVKILLPPSRYAVARLRVYVLIPGNYGIV